jgi:ribosomal protein S3AE
LSRFLTLQIKEIAADSLRGRVFEISLADLQNENHEAAWRKVKL